MTEVTVVPAQQAHVDYLRGRIRQADVDEVWRSGHQVAGDCVQRGLKQSSKCWVTLAGGEPCMIFGVAPVSVLSRTGTPWMLATDRIEDIKPSVARRSRHYVGSMMEGFDLLRNWVDFENTRSILWLKRLGFTVEDPAPYGPEGHLFRYFWRKKDV